MSEAGSADLAARLCEAGIGLQDTLTGPGGEQVSDNAELVRLGLEVWKRARVTGRHIGEDG